MDSNAHLDLGVCNFQINQTASVEVNTSSIFCLMLLLIRRETPAFVDTRRNKARPYGCLKNVTKSASSFSFLYGRRPWTGSNASLSVWDMPKGAAFATREVANEKR